MVGNKRRWVIASWQRQLASLWVVFLFLSLPFASALQVSDVQVHSIGQNSATVSWTTDEGADSSVEYGLSTDAVDLLETDPRNSLLHELELNGLSSGTEYFFSVSSEGFNETAIDDNNGAYYSFTTEADPDANTETGDSSVPDDAENSGTINLAVEHDEYVGSENVDLIVSATTGSEVRVYVNGGYFAKKDVSEVGEPSVTFYDVPLNRDQSNEIRVEAQLGDISETVTSVVYSDLTHPEIIFDSIAEYVEENTIDISGSVSEEGKLFITVGEQLIVNAQEVTASVFSESVSLEEGVNTLLVEFTDMGGLSVQEELEVVSDTQTPVVDATFSKGNEYYQNRAETDITGTTEAGAAVSLYVYRPRSIDFTPSFDDPWQVVTADSSGEFTFTAVDFEHQPLRLEDFTPVEVPDGLEDVTINGVQSLSAQDEFTYHVYIIAEDRSGKAGYFRDIVTVNSCYSQHFDFQITDVAKYQAPLRLDPTLMDDGREVISSVFTLDYQGSAAAKTDLSTGAVIEEAYEIHSVRFDKACTQSMMQDEAFRLGCTVMGNGPDQQLSNNDGSSYYLTWNLAPSEGLSDKEDDYWNEFQDRQIVFPLKVSVTYQEVGGGESKTQTSCYDMSYFVDIPVASEEYIPDWIAEEGIEAINFTVDKIDKVLPYLEKAILVTGISCMISFGAKIAMRFARIASSNVEYVQGKAEVASGAKSEKMACPSATEQNTLYLESTIESWEKSNIASIDPSVQDRLDEVKEAGENSDDGNPKLLDDRCQGTAGLWKVEAALEQAYKWTCDRVYCRAVPAKWTEFKEVDEIKNVRLEGQQCSVSGSCVPLRKEENCRQYVEVNEPGLQYKDGVLDKISSSGNTCWWKDDEAKLVSSTISSPLYYYDTEGQKDDLGKGVYRLTPVGTQFGDLGSLSSKILVYQEQDGSYCGARDASCSAVCGASKKGNYRSADCFTETDKGLEGPNGEDFTSDMYSADYTSDCFVNEETHVKEQCVCERADTEEGKGALLGAREAIKTHKAGEVGEVSGASEVGAGPVDPSLIAEAASETAGSGTSPSNGVIREKYVYRQDRVYKDSGSLYGTYYPESRFYLGRDISGAFGANYLLDYLTPKKRQTQVDPFNQHIGAFQSVCLSGIRGRLVMLRNILDGLQSCIVEAKYTGLQDAGMCKTLFTQHVCGLVYKAISHFSHSCTPTGFSDTQKGGEFTEGIRAVTSSIQPAMQSSIDDLYSDYDNVAFDNYFGGGAQGFAQSMCLFAFGYDFPLGVDFVQDTAYSVAMKTSALIVPAYREFSNYNPRDLTTIHNYEVAANIHAGCRINDYRVSLKCIGPEDLGAPGVDSSCGGERCDCLNIRSDTYASQRTYLLEAGFGGEPGSVIDIPIESPQKIDSPYRYDHVVLEVNVDPNEDVEKCFAEGYRTEHGGIFYQPIKDVSPPGVISCQAEPLSGRYMCPDIGDVFYGEEGFAYLEAPYIQCQDPGSGEYKSCGTPNMLLLSNPDKDLVVKPYVYTDGAGYCMKIKVSGSGTDYGTKYVEIPEGVSGLLAPSIDIGEISEEMFGVYSNDLKLDVDSSNDNCAELDISKIPASVSRGKIAFDYSIDLDARGDGAIGYRVKIPTEKDVVLKSSEYDLGANNFLIKKSEAGAYLTRADVNSVVFEYNGFEFSNILGNAGPGGSTQCQYEVQVGRGSSRSGRNEASIGVDVSLLQKPEDSSCHSASVPVATTALGKRSEQVTVKIQRESVAVASASDLHAEFTGKDYDDAIALATVLIEEEPGTLDEARGIYYYVASLLMLGGEHWEDRSAAKVENLLDRFFLRQDNSGATVGTQFDKQTVVVEGEFQSIHSYLCVIADELGLENKYNETKYGEGKIGCSEKLTALISAES